MDRQRRRAARYRQEAEAKAHEAYGRAIRAGRDLRLRSPSDVVRHGAQLLEEGERRAGQAISGTMRRVQGHADELMESASQNPTVRSAATKVARGTGNVVGVVRGAAHAVQGLAEGAVFAGRLADPLDFLKSPPGESAMEQLSEVATDVGSKAVQYAKTSIADPGIIVRDIGKKADQWRQELDPSATPTAPTFEEELHRNFQIGQNQGELVFDVGSLIIGGPAATAVKGLPRGANLGNTAKYTAQGFSPKAAAHLAAPYPASNRASHFVPRRTRLPKFLGGGPLPKSYMDGPFNKFLPPEISRGDFYELHYKIDPRFSGPASAANAGAEETWV